MTREALVARVRAFVDGDRATSFDALARDVAAYQAAGDGGLTDRLRAHPDDVPAVPVALFKQLAVGTVPPEDRTATVFRTSGTTKAGRGVHRMRDASLYEHGAVTWAVACLGRVEPDVVALLEDPRTAPDSSLSHMIATFGARFARRTSWHVHDGALDRGSLAARLADLAGPAFVASTAFALAYWLRHDVAPLPAGSTLMVTGGFKGRVLDVDGDALLADAGRRLGCRVVTEYGMTELSSQLWGTPTTPYRAPPWLRVTAVDPWSGVAVPAGQRGQLRFLDLCNVDAAVHVETLDHGVVHDDGSVTLLGRLPGAEIRGCSIPLEAVLLR